MMEMMEIKAKIVASKKPTIPHSSCAQYDGEKACPMPGQFFTSSMKLRHALRLRAITVSAGAL